MTFFLWSNRSDIVNISKVTETENYQSVWCQRQYDVTDNRDDFFFQLFFCEKEILKIAGHDQNRSNMTFLKGSVDGFSYFHWFSVILFSTQNHPWDKDNDISFERLDTYIITSIGLAVILVITSVSPIKTFIILYILSWYINSETQNFLEQTFSTSTKYWHFPTSWRFFVRAWKCLQLWLKTK